VFDGYVHSERSSSHFNAMIRVARPLLDEEISGLLNRLPLCRQIKPDADCCDCEPFVRHRWKDNDIRSGDVDRWPPIQRSTALPGIAPKHNSQ
jgi:hypothetical protein